jgi:hypothetical protein
MTELFRLFTQIALLRRGPQDVPASAVLLTLTIVAYFLVNSAVTVALPPADGPWAAQLLVDVGAKLIWYVVLLKLLGKSERILQTLTALFAIQTIVSPVLDASEYLVRRFQQDSVWQLPFGLLVLALVIWFIAANGHIIKAALEWSSPTSVAMAILQIFVGDLLKLAFFPIKP